MSATPCPAHVALVSALEAALAEAAGFAEAQDVSPSGILEAAHLQRLKLIAQAVEILVAPDERRRAFLRLAGEVTKAYKAVLPDERAAPYLRQVAVIHNLADSVRAKLGPVDISAISAKIAVLLDEKLEGVAILTPIVEGDTAQGRIDLSGIDFERLASLFQASPKVAAERLREAAEEQAQEMAERNPTRAHLVEKLEQLVAAYNAGSVDAERFFEDLRAFINGLDDEEQRAAREGLSEDELAIFDLLTNPEPKLTKAQEVEVKTVSRQLLARLHELIDGLDWTGNQQTRGAVWSEIRVKLNELPEEPYPQELWDGKVGQIWDFVLQRYAQEGVKH